MFAKKYIDKNSVFDRFIEEPINKAVSMIIVIPCLNEPDIISTLESLSKCNKIASVCEVIVIINDSETSSIEIKTFNLKTLNKIELWKSQNFKQDIKLFPIYVPSIKEKYAGAGMARKIGMDEAIRRFNDINKPDGVIVSLDSDCLVSPNYLEQIEITFKNKNCFASTINFEHRLDEEIDDKQKKGIKLYEDYLHYYKNALDYIGFPDSIYTIGSAFAVRAEAYIKQGGMNRRKAGEDFYFLNKLTKLGKIAEINNAFVYPSARVSDRVPFGTGAAMTKWMDNRDNLAITYCFDAFADLKILFDIIDSFWNESTENLNKSLCVIPDILSIYLDSIQFNQRINEIKSNCSSVESFRKRFFQFFDAFIILKYLNFAHQNGYQKELLYKSISRLKNIRAIEN